MLNVVLIEDSVEIQAMLRQKLARIPEVDLLGAAEGTKDAKRLIDDCQPDVVLLDVALRDGDRGLDVLRHVTRCHPEAQVVALSNFSWQAMREGFLQAGAAAYFDKSFQVDKAMEWISHRAAAERGPQDLAGVVPSGQFVVSARVSGSLDKPCSMP